MTQQQNENPNNQTEEREEKLSLMDRFLLNPIRAILGITQGVDGVVDASNGLVDVATGNFSRGGTTLLQSGKKIITTPINMGSKLITGEALIETPVDYEKNEDGTLTGTPVTDTIENTMDAASNIISGGVEMTLSPFSENITQAGKNLANGGEKVLTGLKIGASSFIPTLRENADPVSQTPTEPTPPQRDNEKG
ncbi:MAG: hypothetical protein J6V53_05680 [Alphaproteobacteria bacterium]|nr:hypothetical protein [Alphaproteobacteria bacterium]